MDELKSNEIKQEYRELEKLKQFPKPGVYPLQSHDGSVVNATFYQTVTVRSKTVGDITIFQKCGDYDEKYVEFLAGELRYRRNCGFDNIIMVTGEERSGKSTVALKMALAMDPSLSIDKITFKLDDFNKAIASAKDGDIILMDEAGVDLYSKEWWDEFQIQLVKKLFIIGMMHLTLIIVLPHRLDLNKDIRDRRVKYWINVAAERHTLKRGFAVVRECVANEWYKDPFWDTLATFHFTSMDVHPFTPGYLKKKAEFVWEMNNTEYMVRGNKKTLEQIMEIAFRYRKLGHTQKECADLVGVDQATFSRWETDRKG